MYADQDGELLGGLVVGGKIPAQNLRKYRAELKMLKAKYGDVRSDKQIAHDQRLRTLRKPKGGLVVGGGMYGRRHLMGGYIPKDKQRAYKIALHKLKEEFGNIKKPRVERGPNLYRAWLAGQWDLYKQDYPENSYKQFLKDNKGVWASVKGSISARDLGL